MADPEELVRRLAAAVRAGELYASEHPLTRRAIGAVATAAATFLGGASSTVIGFIGDDVIVNDARLTHTAGSFSGFARGLRDREIEKITVHRGVTPDEWQGFVIELARRRAAVPLGDRLAKRGVRHIVIGKLAVDASTSDQVGIAAARQVYSTAVESAETLWDQAKAGDKPNPDTARKIIDSLANIVHQDRTSLMALTALKKYDDYTFTHMVNVAALAMALARSLNLDGPLLREFGFAALMHDIGKVHTPVEVLNKPGKFTPEEFRVMQRHVVDGAHILRRTPEMPALAPIVAFEHHLKQDLSGYPERIGHRDLNLCTMIVSITDVFDALRSNRPYREGLATARIRAIMGEQGNPAFSQPLLRRFVNMMGLFPIGTIVRLNTEEVGVVTAEHPEDPFRPQVKVLFDGRNAPLEHSFLANTWERDWRGEFARAVVESVDPDSVAIDPLQVLAETQGDAKGEVGSE
jgi:putative nucleotidyltransferase with HDIG domain